MSHPKVPALLGVASSPVSRTVARRARTVPAWICYLVLGAMSASVFLISDRPWVQAWVQMPVYGLSAALLAWRWWQSRTSNPDPLLTLAVAAFVLYLSASILGALVPLLTPPTVEVPVPSGIDGLFFLSYGLLGLFLWRLGSRSGGAGRRDILDTLIVVGGVAPVFWVFLVAPLFETGAPLATLLTLVAYPTSVFALFCLTVRLAFVARRRTVPHLLLGGWIVGELSRRPLLPVRHRDQDLFLRAVVAGVVDRLRDLPWLPCPAPASHGSPASDTRSRTSTAPDGCGCWPGAWPHRSSRSSTRS